jgi:RNA polymerase sigma-70 factor (family 1)
MADKFLPNESELLEKIASGDKRAFTELFEFYQRYVYVYGKNLTRSDELAAEIVQDIFLKIWLGREKLKKIDNFGAYLNRIVRNHSLNVIRQIAQQIKSNAILKINTKEADESTIQQIDYNEANSMLNQAINNLPPQQRMVYHLCHLEGLKYEEAAVKMNISVRTVQAHLGQALKHIREHFKKNAMAYPLLVGLLLK